MRSKGVLVCISLITLFLMTSSVGVAKRGARTSGFLELMAWLGGPMSDVAVQGEVAFVAISYNVMVVDIAEPSTPVELGSTTILTDELVAALVVAGDYVYAVSANGLHVIDVSDHANPYQVGYVDLAGATLVARGDQYVYVATDSALYAIDAYEVTAPAVMDSIPLSSIRAIVMDEARLYALDSNTLWIIDTIDPENLIVVGSLSGLSMAQALGAAGNHVYVGDEDGMHIVDVSIPNSPTVVTVHPTSSNVGERSELIVEDELVYFIRNRLNSGALTVWNDLEIIDVSEPGSPMEIGVIEGSSLAYKLEVADGQVFVVGVSGLRVIDVADPSTPFEVSLFELPIPTPHSLSCVNHLCYGIDWSFRFFVTDVVDPSRPRLIGSADLAHVGFDLVVDSGHAYVVAHENGLRILDIANPENPIEVGYVMTDGYVRSAAVDGDYLFVAASESGLWIFDISDPASPIEVSSLELSASARFVTVSDGLAFITGTDTRGNPLLWVVDISSPTNPTQVGHHEMSMFSSELVVVARNAFVLDEGLRIFDVAHPSSIVEMGYVDLPGWPSGIEVAGDFAFVTTAEGGPVFPPTVNSGLRLIDVSDLTAPVEIDSYITQGDSFDVALSGDIAYVADFGAGLTIMRGHRLEQELFLPLIRQSDFP